MPDSADRWHLEVLETRQCIGYGIATGSVEDVTGWHIMVNGQWQRDGFAYFMFQSESATQEPPLLGSQFSLWGWGECNGVWEPMARHSSGRPMYSKGDLRLYRCDAKSRSNEEGADRWHIEDGNDQNLVAYGHAPAGAETVGKWSVKVNGQWQVVGSDCGFSRLWSCCGLS